VELVSTRTLGRPTGRPYADYLGDVAMSNAYKRRDSLRLKDYDYSSEGAYFVTVSCSDKKEYFNSPSIKEIVEVNLKNLNKRFNVTVDHFCIMPDHVHLILFFKEKQGFALSQVIQAYKSLVAKEIRDKFGISEKIWQRGFYDHIIRNEKDYLEKAQYILNNQLKKDLQREAMSARVGVELVSTRTPGRR